MRVGVGVGVLLACAVVAACGTPASAVAEQGALGAAHLGVPLSAPAPPTLSEAGEVGYEWRRCSFYTTMVSADGAAHLWPLDDSSGSAADVVGSSSGRYLGAHAPAPGGPLIEQGGAGAAFDGVTSAVTLPGAADPQGVGAYTYRAVGPADGDRWGLPVSDLRRGNGGGQARGHRHLALQDRARVRALERRREHDDRRRAGIAARRVEPRRRELRRLDDDASSSTAHRSAPGRPLPR